MFKQRPWRPNQSTQMQIPAFIYALFSLKSIQPTSQDIWMTELLSGTRTSSTSPKDVINQDENISSKQIMSESDWPPA